MSADGIGRMRAYMQHNPPASVTQRRRIVSAFLDKFALPEQIEQDVELPGWTEETVEAFEAAYRKDIARIASLPGVTLLTA